MIGIDTNVVLRWLLDDDPRQKALADELFGGLTAKRPGFLNSVTMVELCWVLRSVYRYSRDEVHDALEGLLTSEELEFDDGEGLWESLLEARAGADFPDAVIRATAEQFGCGEVVTFDRGAAERLGMRLLE